MSVTIEHIKEIYKAFRRAQSDFHNRAFTIPKDFEKHFNNRFKEQNKKKLIKITGYFLTKWQSIDPYKYFQCGFELHGKNFSYVRFFNDKILLLYKTRDKIEKRNVNITKENLIKSAKFVKRYMQENNLDLESYMKVRNGNQRIVVEHYINNNIDAVFVVYLIQKGMILTDIERSVMPYVQVNFRKIKFGLNDIKDFVKKLEKKL